MNTGHHRNDCVGHGGGPPILQSCRNEVDQPPVRNAGRVRKESKINFGKASRGCTMNTNVVTQDGSKACCKTTHLWPLFVLRNCTHTMFFRFQVLGALTQTLWRRNLCLHKQLHSAEKCGLFEASAVVVRHRGVGRI